MAGNFWDQDQVVVPTNSGPRVIVSGGAKEAAVPAGYRVTPDGNLEPIPGGPADPVGNVASAPGDANLTGDDYLKTIPAPLAAQVKALSEGRRAFPTGAALRSRETQELIAAASQYDPTLDAANAATRVATRKDFTSGAASKNITSMNTALGHLGSLWESAQKLHNSGWQDWNKLANRAITKFGDPRVKEFGIARDAVANELMKVFRNTGGSLAEIEDWKKTIDAADSPDQFRAEIGKAVELLNSRLEAMGDQYSRGMGTSADPLTFLNPHAQSVFNALAPGGNGVIAAAPGAPGGSGGSDVPPPPGGRPDPGDIQFGNDDRLEGEKVRDELQARVNRGDSVEQLNAWLQSVPRQPLTAEDAAAIEKARKEGSAIHFNLPTDAKLTQEEQAQVDQQAGETDATGAAVTGAADTITMGALDKLGAGVEALGDSLSGKGSFTDRFGRNLMMDKAILEKIGDDHPWAYPAGQVAGGLVLPMFGARTPAELAKVGAAYGGAYGAGSSDSLAEVPGNVIAGAAVGAGSGWGGGKLAQKLEARAAAKAASLGTDPAESAATRYGRGQQFGVDLSVGDSGGMAAKVGERILDVQPGSSGVMNNARQKLSGQIDQAVEDVAGTYGPSTSFDGMGRAAQSGVRKWQDKFEQVASKAYSLIPISEKTAARLDNTRQALGELTTVFESNPKMAEAFQNTRLNRYMDALDPDQGGGLSWKDLKEFRSRIGEEIGDQRFSESPTKTELRRLYGALSEDMRATATAQGPKAIKAFERANTLYRAGQQRIDDAVKFLVGDDGAMSAEKAAARIQAMVKSGKASSDLSKLAEVRKSLPPSEAGELVNGVIKLLGQPANSAGRDFQAQTFIRNFKDMAPEAKNLLFGGAGKELRQNLEEFAKVMGDVAASDATRNTSNTAMGLSGLIGFGAGGWMGLIAQAATSYGAARLWTSPKFVRWATGFSKMEKAAARAAKLDPDKVKVQTRLLDKLAASDPSLAQDVLPVRDAILKAVNDNASRSAAASGGDDQQDSQ
jgi:hypothetical protein